MPRSAGYDVIEDRYLVAASLAGRMEAYDELVRYGCDYAQGYFICRPIPAAALDLWLVQREVTAGNG